MINKVKQKAVFVVLALVPSEWARSVHGFWAHSSFQAMHNLTTVAPEKETKINF